MASGIDVLFSGLMVICLTGDSAGYLRHCPEGNVAWAIKADGVAPCGWPSDVKTILQVRYLKDDFTIRPYLNSCHQETEQNKIYVVCQLPFSTIEVKVPGYPGSHNEVNGIESMLRIDEVDDRFQGIDFSRLSESPKITFPFGRITGGPHWSHSNDSGYIKWERSKGLSGNFPRELSDSLQVNYPFASDIELFSGGIPLLTLTPNCNGACTPITIRNYGENLVPYYAGNQDYLTYLLFYYRLAQWRTASGECPTYSDAKQDAVILVCKNGGQQGNVAQGCSYNINSTTRFWPPNLFPDLYPQH